MTQLTQAAKSWSNVPQIDQADGEALPKTHVSVKLTACYSQFDPLDVDGSSVFLSLPGTDDAVDSGSKILVKRAAD